MITLKGNLNFDRDEIDSKWINCLMVISTCEIIKLG